MPKDVLCFCSSGFDLPLPSRRVQQNKPLSERSIKITLNKEPPKYAARDTAKLFPVCSM